LLFVTRQRRVSFSELTTTFAGMPPFRPNAPDADLYRRSQLQISQFGLPNITRRCEEVFRQRALLARLRDDRENCFTIARMCAENPNVILLERRCKVTTVKDVLDQKGRDVYSISPVASVFEALQLMADNNIASLVVLDDGKLVGIMSERIYAREIILKGRTSFGTLVREVMSTRVLYAQPCQSVQECMTVMAANDIRHLPVLQNDELVVACPTSRYQGLS
jgi:CBS domain-containing protein